MEIMLVPEEELKLQAEEAGPSSPAATIIRQLNRKRAKDRQVSVWQVGSYYFVGPVPDAETEAAIIRFAQDD